ncbi:MAG: hypothetical protein Ct9H300mP3_03900 [Gammaproteobacteria bacterium]|nr:MAG: hypothetical protein Ct9H300mP3_03900 [Gammaproteobacteria bacterium]
MNSAVRSEVSKLEKKIGNKGRVLIRPSGTEDLLRVMVEASTKELAKILLKIYLILYAKPLKTLCL